jgi:2,5-diamino-6-(ribosylamino)-4(3H)-pyrimidinone 5'-phosphate reductase
MNSETTKLRLYPEPSRLADKEEIYGDLWLPAATDSDELPYVLVNMVGSVDGRSSVGGRATGIGSSMDRRVMRSLRSRVDAVMVGSGTLRAEKLSLGLDDPGAGQPLAVVVGGTGDAPIRERLVGRHRGVVLAVPRGSSSTAATEGAPLTVIETPTTGGGRVDLAWLLGALKAEHGVRRLLVEGGPRLNRSMIDGGLAHELFLTIAPKLLLGPESSILSGEDEDGRNGTPRDLTLLSAHSAGDELFLRYRLDRPRRRP